MIFLLLFLFNKRKLILVNKQADVKRVILSIIKHSKIMERTS